MVKPEVVGAKHTTKRQFRWFRCADHAPSRSGFNRCWRIDRWSVYPHNSRYSRNRGIFKRIGGFSNPM